MSQTTQSGTPVKQFSSNGKRRPKPSHPKGVKASEKPRKASRKKVVLTAISLLEARLNDPVRRPLDEAICEMVVQALWIYASPGDHKHGHSHSPRHAFGYVAGMAYGRWEDDELIDDLIDDLIAEAEEEFIELMDKARLTANKKTGIQPSRRELVAA